MKTRAWDGERWRADYAVMPSGEICMMTAGKDFFVDKSIILVPQPDWKLSRFTGLCDKNGKEIWEGDILPMGTSIRTINSGTHIKPIYDVVRMVRGIWEPIAYWKEEVLEVIGNIHDNPELLESEV